MAAFKLSRMPTVPSRLERALEVIAMTLGLVTEPASAFLWRHLGRKSVALCLAALVALCGLPWLTQLPLWWTLVNLPLSWAVGGTTGALAVKWARQRQMGKLMADIDGLDSIGGRPLWFGLDGKPISIAEANELLGSHIKRRVAQTDIDGWRVSTVFLVLNHNWGEGPPVLWETIVFNTDGDVEGMARYTSREDAQQGHDKFVADVRNVFRQLRTLNMPDVPKPNGGSADAAGI